MISKGSKRAAGASRLLVKRGRKGANLSRRKLMESRRESLAVKRKKSESQRKEAKIAQVQRIQAQQNKKKHQLFQRAILQCVQDGLVESIQSLGEVVTPLSLFMAATTALSKSSEKHHMPYVLAIMTACAPRLSQGILLHQLEPSVKLMEQIIAENVSRNHLVVAKAMKLAQQMILSISAPSMKVMQVFGRLEPSKLQVDTMRMYVVAFRKMLERAALCSTSGSRRVKDPIHNAYQLGENEKFFVQALPSLMRVCVSTFTDAPVSLVSSVVAELKGLFSRAISPYIVESSEGRHMIENMISTQLLELLKPHCQVYWSFALELIEALFDRVNYLKRTATGDAMSLTVRFPTVPFLLRVLDKLRGMENPDLNSKIERSMIAIGKGMFVREFVEILPFNIRMAYEAQLSNRVEDESAVWGRNYTVHILRRIAPHDSLPFFAEHILPNIQFIGVVLKEYEKQQQSERVVQWSVLLQQFWRVVLGFCHYPRIITKESFVEVAKQLVGIFAHPQLVDTSATALHVLCDGYHELAKTASFDDDNNDGDYDEEEEEERLAGDERTDEDHKKRRALPVKGTLEEDHYFLSLNDPTWNPHVYHGISQAEAQNVCTNVIAKFSANIMPKLCNTFEHHDSTAILSAIRSFSRICTPEVMHVILKGILNLGTIISQETLERECPEPGSRAGHAPLTSKRRMVLDISYAIVPQLETEHITTLFTDIIEPVLMDPAPESRLLQKKAYKLLYALFEHRIQDIFSFFPRIAGILSVGRQHVTISGTKMRLRCLVWAIDACKMYHPDQLVPMIRGIVGEVIMLSRERSSETRAASMDLLEKMHRYLVAAGCPVNALLHLVIAGFSGKTPMMISCSLVAMAKLVHVAHQKLPTEDLNAAVALGFRMMESAALEVRASAAMFARMVLKIMKRCPRVASAVENALPKILLAIALVTSQPHVSSNTRMQMRVLLEKCIKRFGYDRLDPIFPIGSKNFLRYTQKMLRREEKKEERKLKVRGNESKNEFDRLFLGVSIKSGAADDAERDLLQAGSLAGFVSKYTNPSSFVLSSNNGKTATGGQHGDDNGSDGGDELDTMHLDFCDGKLRIMSVDEKRNEEERQRRQAMADRLLRRGRGVLNPEELNSHAVGSGSKRTRSDVEDFENDELFRRYGSKATEEAAQRAAASQRGRVGPGVNQLEKQRDQKREKRDLKRMRVEEDVRKGEEFEGAGEGDVKRGGVEPFAYVPLNRTYMNRRYKRQAIQRLQAVTHTNLKGNKAKILAGQVSKRKRDK